MRICGLAATRASQCAVLVLLLVGLCATASGQGVGITSEIQIEEDGKLQVTWSTRHDCTGSRVSFGVDYPDDPFGLPQYRLRVSAKGSPRSHAAETTLKSIEDALGGVPFNGKVFYRITGYDEASNEWIDSGDCVFRYTKNGDSYARRVAIVEGPIVANITTDSAMIRWVTDMPSRGEVVLNGRRTSSASEGEIHEVVLQNLNPNSIHPYRILVKAGDTDSFQTRSYSLRTAPPLKSGEGFSFAVISDTRAHDHTPVPLRAMNGVNADVLRSLVLDGFRKGMRFAVIPGDLVTGTSSDGRKVEAQLRSWKKTVRPISHYVPFFTGMGNHDANVYDQKRVGENTEDFRKKGKYNAEEMFRREMTNPTNGPLLPEGSEDPTYSENVYSFDYGNSHFVMLNNDYKALNGDSKDNEKGKIVGLQLEWLKQDLDLASKRGLENIFVFLHEPGFPNGGHLGDSMYHNGSEDYVKPRNEFWRILCQHEVVAVFCGHEHNYSRTLIDQQVDKSFSRPIWQIVTGGGGAPFHKQDRAPWSGNVKAFHTRHHYCLLSVAGRQVMLRVYDVAGSLIEEARLR
jgi:hypothetical protein